MTEQPKKICGDKNCKANFIDSNLIFFIDYEYCPYCGHNFQKIPE